MTAVSWLAEARDGEIVAMRVGRSGDDLVAEWVGTGTLRVRHDGSEPRFHPDHDADPVAVEKLRRGVVRLLLRQIEGKLGLHAAAVSIEGRAVVIVGATGDGKSTLAAALCSRGAELLSDDATAIDRVASEWFVAPFEDIHWLDPEARPRVGLGTSDTGQRGKVPVPANRVARSAAPARAILVLSFRSSESPSLERLRACDAVGALVPFVMRLVVDDPTLQRSELDALSDLVAEVPIFRLERPRDLERLSVACDLVMRSVQP